MRLSTKHPNQQTVSLRDFSGGLNTTDAIEAIAQNELGSALNVCLDKSTGMLRTVDGTNTLLVDNSMEFNCIMVDPWSKVVLVTTTDGTVCKVSKWQDNVSIISNGTEYAVGDWAEDGKIVDADGKRYAIDVTTLVSVGSLTGTKSPIYTTWEDGLLIASGAKLQYYHGNLLETISTSPDVCNGVFVRDGRVWTWHDDRIRMSRVGDEQDWTHDNNDDSSAQYVDIGYKDRGNIEGVAVLSADVVVFKDNGHAYHIVGQYPDWTVKSVGRQLGIKNYECCLAVGNSVLVLGDGKLQQVETTEDYGEMKAATLSGKVEVEVRQLGKDTRMRYLPTLNEVWFIDNKAENQAADFLVLDASRGAFFHRRYNSVTRDAASLGDETYVLKEHNLSMISHDNMMRDEEVPMEWEIRPMSMSSYNQFLVKHIYVDTTPFFDTYCDHRIYVGDVQMRGSLPSTARGVWHNYGTLCGDQRYIVEPWNALVLTDTSEDVYKNDEQLWKKRNYVRPTKCYRAETRCVDRRRTIPIRIRGQGGVMLLNQIAFDYAEV